jgi:uncharacterized protein YbaR (Trm112 family)
MSRGRGRLLLLQPLPEPQGADREDRGPQAGERQHLWPEDRRAAPLEEENDEPTPARVPRSWAWADLMRRAFDIDVLACPRCGGRLRLIATVEDPNAIRAILVALAEFRELVGRAPPGALALNPSHTAAISA